MVPTHTFYCPADGCETKVYILDKCFGEFDYDHGCYVCNDEGDRRRAHLSVEKTDVNHSVMNPEKRTK
jgi:hypothetical protein